MTESWGIILAAGESRRMKEPKLLLPFKESTIFECALDNVLGSNIDKVMVVLGGAKEKVKSLIGIRPVMICINDHFRDGMLSSVKCGIRALPVSAKAILVYLADQPLISPSVTNILLNAWREEKV